MSKESRRVRETREGVLATLDEMRNWIKEHGESVQAALQTHSDTSVENLQNLCDYVDTVEDKVNGTARALYAYTDLVAAELEALNARVNQLEYSAYATNAEGREEHWAPRLNEGILIGASQASREERLRAYAGRHPDVVLDTQHGEQRVEESVEEKALHEMNEQELLAATEAAVDGEVETQYPEGTQVFGD